MEPQLNAGSRSWLLSRYTQGPRTTLIFLLLLLATAAYITWSKVTSHFRDEINDPRLRHVVVEGNPSIGEWPISDESLANLDRTLGDLNTPRRKMRSAFGRITGTNNIPFSYVGKNGEKIGDEVNGRVLRIDVDEPVTSAIMVKSPNRPDRSLRDVMASYGASRLDDGTRAIVVLPEILIKLRDRNSKSGLDIDPNKIMIKHKAWETFTIVGEAKEQPRDRSTIFDAVVSLDQHKEWMLQVDPEAVPGNQIPFYERVAVYFDTGSYRDTQNYLDREAYVFDRGNLDKLVRLLDISIGIDTSLIVLLGVVLLVTLVSAANVVRLYIQQNEKRLAVIVAHGAPDRLPIFSLVSQVVFAWVIAIPILVAFLAILVIASRWTGIAFLPDKTILFPDLPLWIEATLPAVATLFVLVVTTIATFRSWRRKHSLLARALQKS